MTDSQRQIDNERESREMMTQTETNRQDRQTHRICCFVGCFTSQQCASVSQGWICSDNFTCFHIEIHVADQTFYPTQSQITATRPTSPSADPITPGAWQSSRWSADFQVTGTTRPGKIPWQAGFEPLDEDALTTRPTRRWTDRTARGVMARREARTVG